MSTVTDSNTFVRKSDVELLVNVQVEWLLDETPDLSHLGEYVRSRVDGALDRKAEGCTVRDRELQFFLPMNNRKFDKKDWAHVSKAKTRAVIKEYGSLEKATHAYAVYDLMRMEAYNDEEWHMTACRVTVSYGYLNAENTLWGIESDCGENHRAEVVEDCLSAALSELKEKLMKRLGVE